MHNQRFDTGHPSPHAPGQRKARETERQKAELEQNIRKVLSPFLPHDQEGRRITDLIVRELSSTWSE
ncbi:MAG: hypothetical protein V1876_02840, partial [Candidatus Peregrinibacteria bacterium]